MPVVSLLYAHILTDSETIDFVSLLVQADDRVLVDVVRGDDGQAIEPRDVEVTGNAFEGFPGQTG